MDATDRNVMFVVNPNSRGGKTSKRWEHYKKVIDSTFTLPYDHCIADKIDKGRQLTVDAINEGYTDIIGVGGEGTINEVVNGVFNTNPTIRVGFIRSGTINDFLSDQVYNWPTSIEDQLLAIEAGEVWNAPLTKVSADYTRYSLNIANAGIGAKISYDASIKRRLTWVFGGLRYYLLALLNAFTWENNPATVHFDDRTIEGDLTLFMAGFSKQGGGFITLPHASLDDGKMAYLFVRDFSRLKILRFLNTVKRGDHDESIEGVHMGHSQIIRIETENPLMFEVDGEPFSYDSKRIEIEAIPGAIPIISHNGIVKGKNKDSS